MNATQEREIERLGATAPHATVLRVRAERELAEARRQIESLRAIRAAEREYFEARIKCLIDPIMQAKLFQLPPPILLSVEEHELLERAESAERENAELREQLAREGHEAPCYYCGKPCNSLAGNPSEWPVALCHADDPGRVKWHHTGCVSERLVERDALREQLESERKEIIRLDATIGWLREQLAAAQKKASKAREDALEEARKACSGKRWGIDCAVAIRELKR